jgi:hypothetical protein
MLMLEYIFQNYMTSYDIVSDITSKDLHWLKSIQVSLNLYHLQKDTVIVVCVWTQKRSNKQQKLNIWE